MFDRGFGFYQQALISERAKFKKINHRGKLMAKDKKEKSDQQGKLSNKEYETEMTKLHAELVKLQYWVQEKGLKVIVVFEGRDAAWQRRSHQAHH